MRSCFVCVRVCVCVYMYVCACPSLILVREQVDCFFMKLGMGVRPLETYHWYSEYDTSSFFPTFCI